VQYCAAGLSLDLANFIKHILHFVDMQKSRWEYCVLHYGNHLSRLVPFCFRGIVGSTFPFDFHVYCGM
jgi:hypothetical protein